MSMRLGGISGCALPRPFRNSEPDGEVFMTRDRKGGKSAPADGARVAPPDGEGLDAAEGRQSPLAALRREIDAIDDELLTLLNRRAELSVRVGQWKRNSGQNLAVFQPAREREVLDGLVRRNAALGGVLPNQAVEHVWREIFSSSRSLQQPLSVAFLGPKGTFSHMAALECLGHSADMRPVNDFHTVFREVAAGRCDLGLVPLENSLHGTVGQNFDLFAEHAVHVVREHYSRITNCLMSAEESLDHVRRVYSHPQPLGQCAGWLRAHLPGVPLVPEDSTAAAAERAAGEEGAAAIGHPGLAAMLNLRVLAASLEDSADNWTRFVLIAPGGAEAVTGRSSLPDESLKTSLLFTVPHCPGSLAAALNVLARGGINMTKLESRPMRGAVWQYVFFVDTGCDLLHAAHQGVMNALRAACQSVRVLGVYPHVEQG